MKIIMTVHHGQLIANEQVSADSFEDCLDKLEKTRLYIGYGPKLRENILLLKEKGVLWFDVNPSSFARSVEKMVLNKTSFQVENLKYLNPQTEYLEGYNEALNDLLKILDAKQ